VKQQPVNIIVGLLTCYLAGTAWSTVPRQEGEPGISEFGAMLVAWADGAAAVICGFQLANTGTPFQEGMPAAPYFIFGSLALLAGAMDVRMLLRGGVSGAKRILRHVWRMCLALLIATLFLFP
jgi:hypothetical protein